MKTFFALLLLAISGLAVAENCTSVVRDRRGYEYESFTRSSYSQQAACDQATYECRGALAYGQSVGRYYDATCEIKFDRPNPTRLVCQTDLIDYYGRVVRSFSAPGASEREACDTSNMFCQSELSRNTSNGYRCLNKGISSERPPQPGRNRTENCTANRLDPAGVFLQSYFATSTGPMGTDVRGDACRRAVSICSRDLRGRQTCNIGR